MAGRTVGEGITPKWHAHRPFRAICLDGGGYLGLATASFLEELERHFGINITDHFDLFCGASTGGIIALALAHGLTAKQIVDLYLELGSEVFSNPFPGSRALRLLRGLFAARYSNKPLKKALDSTFGDSTLRDVLAHDKHIVVPAFCLTTGMPRVFKTDHAEGLSAHSGYLLRDIALATSAAPVFLPIAAIRSPTSGAVERFVDGGVYANNPALLALTEALGYLDVPPSCLQIASISTPRQPRGLAEASKPLTWLERVRLSRGLVRWGSTLAELFIGAGMQVTHSAVNRVVANLVALSGGIGRYERFELHSAPGLGLDIATCKATEALRHIGSDTAMQSEVRVKFQAFLGVK